MADEKKTRKPSVKAQARAIERELTKDVTRGVTETAAAVAAISDAQKQLEDDAERLRAAWRTYQNSPYKDRYADIVKLSDLEQLVISDDSTVSGSHASNSAYGGTDDTAAAGDATGGIGDSVSADDSVATDSTSADSDSGYATDPSGYQSTDSNDYFNN